jgi:hypothetical protein
VRDEPPLDCELEVFCGEPSSAKIRVGAIVRQSTQMIVRLSSIDLNFFITVVLLKVLQPVDDFNIFTMLSVAASLKRHFSEKASGEDHFFGASADILV